MGRDALKLGMIQKMILYCARILYLKCIFGTKSKFGRSFPNMLANKWGRVIRSGRGISKRIGGWMLTGKWVRFPYTPQKVL